MDKKRFSRDKYLKTLSPFILRHKCDGWIHPPERGGNGGFIDGGMELPGLKLLLPISKMDSSTAWSSASWKDRAALYFASAAAQGAGPVRTRR
ncbi:MAG: hypothetical protein GY859_15705 [Desulfobacterales bacterium]|nr:hypothetical protein [Desulfobacterales bacterium]